MKAIITITAIVLIIFSSIFILGLIQEEEHTLEKGVNIGAPAAVVFNTVIDFDHHKDWCKNIVENSFNADYTQRVVRYKLWPKDFTLSESIEVDLQKRRIITYQDSSNPSSHLQKFENEIRLVSLPDGSTQVFWRISYKMESVFGKFLNKIFVKPQIQEMVEENLQGLVNYIDPN